MLASEGLFHGARDMAKKTVTLYSLLVPQLSKQEEEHYHYDYDYDYGLRKPSSRAQHGGAAEEKRIDPTMAEEGGYFDEGRSTPPLLSLT